LRGVTGLIGRAAVSTASTSVSASSTATTIAAITSTITTAVTAAGAAIARFLWGWRDSFKVTAGNQIDKFLIGLNIYKISCCLRKGIEQPVDGIADNETRSEGIEIIPGKVVSSLHQRLKKLAFGLIQVVGNDGVVFLPEPGTRIICRCQGDNQIGEWRYVYSTG